MNITAQCGTKMEKSEAPLSDTISEQFLICSLCTEEFNDPRSLPCLHSFCTACLQQYIKAQNLKPLQDLSCPVCRSTCTLPAGGVEELKPNHFLKSLQALVGKASKAPSCGLCVDGSTAVLHCLQCNVGVCQFCKDCHPRMIATKDHSLVGLDDLKAGAIEDQRKSTTPFCLEHQAPKDLFCENKDCKLPICFKCKVLHHEGHPTQTLAGHSREDRTKLELLCTELDAFQEDTEKMIESEEEEKMTITNVQTKLHREIDDLANILSQKLALCQKNLKIKVTDALKESTDMSQKRLSLLQEKQTSVKDVRNMTQELLAHSTHAELASAAPVVMDRAKILLNLELPEPVEWKTPVLIGGKADVDILGKMLGTVQVDSEEEEVISEQCLVNEEDPELLPTAIEVKSFQSSVEEDPEIVQVYDMCSGPDGEIAILDGNRDNKRLKVFSSEGELCWATAPGALTKSTCSVIWSPTQEEYIVATIIVECIEEEEYYGDNEDICYYYATVNKYSVNKLTALGGHESESSHLSVNKNGYVVCTFDSWLNIVDEKNEKTIITLSDQYSACSFHLPYNCILRLYLGKVYVVDRWNMELWSFTGTGKVHICADDFGHSFIANTLSHEILMFSFAGKCVNTIRGLPYPGHLTVNKPGHLAVIESQSGLVKIYRYLK